MQSLLGFLPKGFGTAQGGGTASVKGVPISRWVFVGLGVLALIAGFAVPQYWQSLAAVREAGTMRRSQPEGSLVYTPPQRPEIPDAGALLQRLGIGTVLVLGLCVGTLWMVKRWLGGGLVESAKAGKRLQVLETLPLGSRGLIYLIRADDQHLLAGVDPSGLKALLPLPESFEAALPVPPPGKDTLQETDSPRIVPMSGPSLRRD